MTNQILRYRLVIDKIDSSR